ncbi:MAG: DUF11 domain-containing protein [Clostridia bacterium]|nr:DUF11 domain-containing protein [Clostridia bacterium]
MKAYIKIVIAAAAALLVAGVVCLIVFLPKENAPKMLEKMEFEKYASPAMTVSEGGEITYTVKITSNAGKRARLLIKDTLPENTVLVGGDFTAEGTALSAKVTVKARETVTVSYTVRLGAAYKNGMKVSSAAAVIGEKQTNACENIVARTLQGSERSRMKDAILALMYSENISAVKLLRDMYLVAFSEAPKLSEALSVEQILMLAVSDRVAGTETDIGNIRALVAPSLFGGSLSSDAVKATLMGESVLPRICDLVIGDILLVGGETQAKVYIYDGIDLISVMNGCAVANKNAVIADIKNAEAYAVLRPSMQLATLTYAMEEAPLSLTEPQKALIATAKAYLQRGYRAQYDDSRMPHSLSGNYRGEYRWQIGQYRPEDYTSQKWGYLNCAAFTYECYRNALGLDLGYRYTTQNLASYYVNGGTVGAPEYPYFFRPYANMSDADMDAEKALFLETLAVGDLVVIRRNNGNGHVMLYIGNGVLIHSSGASYNYSVDSETYEPTVRYMNILGYLFNPDAANYVFKGDGYVTSLSIVRPLDAFVSEKMEIPENTLHRMEDLADIYSEKLSSHPEGQTASVGDTVTFTFVIKNLGKTEKTLAVEETLPVGATLLSKGSFTESGNKLTASVTVAPGATKELSYSVTVSGKNGEAVYSTRSTVGGVLHTCPRITIANTLTEQEQSAILTAVEKFKSANPYGYVNFELANAIYAEAGLESPFSDESVYTSLFTPVIYDLVKTRYELNTESEYYSMIVPTMYGGLRFYTPERYGETVKPNTDRSRLPRTQALNIGDIVVAKFSSSERVYMYVGSDTLINLSTDALTSDVYSATVRLSRMMSVGNYYAILRPSMG